MTKKIVYVPKTPIKEITSLTHPLVQHLIKLKNSKTYRIQEHSLLLEGRNCISDVTQKKKAKRIITESLADIPEGCKADEILLVSQAIIKKISAVQHPDSILAELSCPEMQKLSEQKYIIALDGLQDPGNLGTLLRTAVALGWEGVFFIEPCCDPFNDKALRAAKGATFEIPMQQGSWQDLAAFIKEKGHTVCAADLEGDAPTAFHNKEKLVLILGNESRGIAPPDGLPCCKVTIPMQGPMESLNVAVAGSILMYALKRVS